jgi:hypothetical protein
MSYIGPANTGNPVANVAVDAVIGGTFSELTGGKFKNGAATAAFFSAIRQDWGSKTFSSSSSNSISKNRNCIAGCGRAEVGNLSDISYERLVEYRAGLYEARAEGYDAFTIDLAIGKINERISSVIGVQAIDTQAILMGHIQRQFLGSQEALVNSLGTVAGYCGLPQCQAISYGVAGLNSVANGDHSGLMGNYATEVGFGLVESRLKLVGDVGHSLDLLKGYSSQELSEYFNGKDQ